MNQEGDEIMIQIPETALEEAGIETGSEVKLVMENNKLIIMAVQ